MAADMTGHSSHVAEHVFRDSAARDTYLLGAAALAIGTATVIAIQRKDDRAVFEGMALDALNQHDCDPEFQRLLLHSALEQHELAHMFWEKFVRRVYHSLRSYIRQRQRDGAIKQVEPFVIVRAFIGMIIHHSLNNNLWDRERQLLKISNQAAARAFTEILLNGVATSPQSRANGDGRQPSRVETPKRKRSKK